MEHSKDKKDKQKSALLFVFALGAILTYIISLFLPLPYMSQVYEKRFKRQNVSTNIHEEMGMDMNMLDTGVEITMKDMMKDMSLDLDGKVGVTFDKAFLDTMILHHEGAIDMARKALMVSKDKNILKLSNDIITTQQKEVEIMKSWRVSLSK